jgi:RNA polymerase sigma-70 factor (ECF subfamily)
MAGPEDDRTAFIAFAREVEPRLSFAFSAAYGPELGRDATAESLAYAWEFWDRVRKMDNPAGYLYRVGQTRVKRYRRRAVVAPTIPSEGSEVWVEPGLPAALAGLSEQQRTAVVLIHAFDWTQQEVAELLGIGRTTVQKHLERGLEKLQTLLEVRTDA